MIAVVASDEWLLRVVRTWPAADLIKADLYSPAKPGCRRVCEVCMWCSMRVFGCTVPKMTTRSTVVSVVKAPACPHTAYAHADHINIR